MGARARFVLGIGVVASAVLASGSAQAQVPPVGATADVRDAAGRLVATAEFREGRGEVLIAILFPSPPALTGTHAVHIEEVGRCDPPDFLSAGADFNPYHKQHGRKNPDGPRVGDLPNVNFTNGLTSYNTSAPGATLGAGTGSLLGPNRTSLVIYAGEDDQTSEPDGNSGSRLACGVITPVGAPGAVPKPAAVQSAVVSPIASPAPAKPVVSPVAAAQPVVPKPVASPVPAVAVSPIPIVPVQPPAPPVAATATQPGSGTLGSGPALIIAVLGVGLVAAGFLLRRHGQLR